MRIGNRNVEEVKQKIAGLKGEEVDLIINKGRNKLVSLKAIVDQIYPSMFVIKPTTVVDLDRFSYSYVDVMCGDVSFES